MKRTFLILVLIPILLVACSTTPDEISKSEIGESPDLSSGTQLEGTGEFNDTPSEAPSDLPPVDPNTPTQNGITVNTITFNELNINAFNEKQKAEINQLKKDRGYITYANNDGGYYVIIFRGEKPTTGYDITVQSVQDNEGNTNITIQEINPVQGTIQGEAITYPTTAIEIKNIADNFFVTNVKGEEFQKLN